VAVETPCKAAPDPDGTAVGGPISTSLRSTSRASQMSFSAGADRLAGKVEAVPPGRRDPERRRNRGGRPRALAAGVRRPAAGRRIPRAVRSGDRRQPAIPDPGSDRGGVSGRSRSGAGWLHGGHYGAHP
jgi:hypothetical protein